MTNILSSIPTILTSLLDPKLAHLLHVTIQHQPTLQSAENDPAGAFYADHALVLTRRSYSNAKETALVVHLVIVEEKQAGYVQPDLWRSGPQGQWAHTPNSKAHLAQLIGYSALTKCKYFFLTDYNTGVAISVKTASSKYGKSAALAAHPHGFAHARQSRPEVDNPVDVSLRHTVCVLGMKALHELGVLDPAKARSLGHHPLDARVARLLHEHKRPREAAAAVGAQGGNGGRRQSQRLASVRR